MSSRPTWSSTRIAFAVVLLERLVAGTRWSRRAARTSGLASASSSAIASSWPGSQSRMIVGHRREDRVDLVGRRQRRLRAGAASAASAPAAQARCSASLRARVPPAARPQRGAERIAGRRAVDRRRRGGGVARATSRPSSSSTAPSAPSVSATSPPRVPTTLVLVAVDDEQIGSLELERTARRRRVQAEEARLRGRGGDRRERDLQLADHRVGFADLDVRRRPGARSRPGATTITFSPLRVDEDQRDAALAVVAHDAARVDALALERAQHEIVAADPPDEARPRARAARPRRPGWRPCRPGTRSNCASVTVSPGRGSRSQRATRSTFAEPTTVIAGGGTRQRRRKRGVGEWSIFSRRP